MNGNNEPYIGMPINLDDYELGIEELPEMLEASEAPELQEDAPMASMNELWNDMMGGNNGNAECICEPDFNNWPLAMAYVPMQRWEETYEPEKALEVGTIFPSLDLPFMGGMKR